MLLKSITLKNFRQFKGEQKIEFEHQGDNKVTVVLGKNTSGKTTLIKSFKWILYGQVDFETKDLINIPVAEELKPGDKEKVKGEVELEHKNTDYIIGREQDYFKKSNGEIKQENTRFLVERQNDSGEYEYLNKSQQEDTINEILPESLAEYFFFHGEEIKDIGENTRSGKKNINEAVESILGLKALKSAIKHLSGGKKTSVIGKLNNRIDTTKNKELDKAKSEKEQKEEELDDIIGEIDDYKNTIEALEKEIKDLNSKIRKHQSTRSIKNEIDNNKLTIKENKNKKKELLNKMTNFISEKAPLYFMRPLIKDAIKVVENNKENYKESIPEMKGESIDFILEKGKCLCGTEIKEGSEEYQELIEYKKFLPPESIGTVIRLFIKDAEHYSKTAKGFYEEYENYIRNIRTLDNEIKELESQNENLREKIKNKPDVGQLEEKVQKKENELERRRTALEEKAESKGKLENKIEDLNNKIKKLAKKNETNNFTLHCLEYAEHINKLFEEKYNEMEDKTKEKLQQRTNEIFNRIYHGRRNIKLANNYEYILESPEITKVFQDKADKSEGLKTVASFSFIAGIVSLAKEKIYDKGDEEQIEEHELDPYPLVMDAPFSDTDEIHIENISQVIPEVTEQTIMIIMEKDWNYAEKALNEKVSKLYEMVKETETITEIEERSQYV